MEGCSAEAAAAEACRIMEGCSAAAAACVNDILTDDDLRSVLSFLRREEDRDAFGLVCKRWLQIQSSERRTLRARAGPAMLRSMAVRFTALVEIDLSQSASRSYFPGVSDSDLAFIADRFPGLRSLGLQYCKGISDASMVSVSKGLSSLQSLNVSYCRRLTDKGLVAIATGCQNLKKLHITSCRSVSDYLLEALSKSCHHLEELGMAGCVNITDFGLSILVSGCKNIQFLDLCKCSNIGDDGISRIANTCSQSLRVLKLLDCYRITDNSVFSIANSCGFLETLVIGGCREVTDESVKTLAFSCGASLKNLRMDWCLNLTDLSIRCILSQCINLTALDIGSCERITDAAFETLGSGNSVSDLRFLKASNCPRITILGVHVLLQFCTQLEYIDLRTCEQVTPQRCDQAGLKFPQTCKVYFAGSLLDMDPSVDKFF